MRALEVDAGRADELGDDDTLGAVDDERALVGHQREVAHEDRLALDLAGLVVHELGRDEERSGVREVALLALLDRVLRRLEAVVAEREAHGAREVLDRGDLLEDLLQTGLRGDVGRARRPWPARPGPATPRCRRASRRLSAWRARRSGTSSGSAILANDTRPVSITLFVVLVRLDDLLALREAAKSGPSEGSRTHPKMRTCVTPCQGTPNGVWMREKAAQRSSLPQGPTACRTGPRQNLRVGVALWSVLAAVRDRN